MLQFFIKVLQRFFENFTLLKKKLWNFVTITNCLQNYCEINTKFYKIISTSNKIITKCLQNISISYKKSYAMNLKLVQISKYLRTLISNFCGLKVNCSLFGVGKTSEMILHCTTV